MPDEVVDCEQLQLSFLNITGHEGGLQATNIKQAVKLGRDH